MIEFSRTKCVEAKKLLGRNRKIRKIWKGFAPSPHVGHCTNLYRILKPNSCEDFYNKYIKYAQENHNLPISERGLCETELIELARRYKKRSEEKGIKVNASEEDYLNDALCHIIVETWDGQHRESEFINFLENTLPQGYKCSKFEGHIDSKYGVDIRVERIGEDGKPKVSAIQIKPITFFQGTAQDVEEDRIALCEKYESIKKYGIKTFYAIYKQNDKTGEVKWMVNTDNRFRFRINDLFGYEPEDIKNTFVRKELTNKFEKLPV